MLRILTGVACVLLLGVGTLVAAEVQGTITKIDADKGLLVVKVGEQTREFSLSQECKCECPFGMELKNGLKTSPLFKAGFPVTVTYETKDGKNVVSKVKSAVKLNGTK